MCIAPVQRMKQDIERRGAVHAVSEASTTETKTPTGNAPTTICAWRTHQGGSATGRRSARSRSSRTAILAAAIGLLEEGRHGSALNAKEPDKLKAGLQILEERNPRERRTETLPRQPIRTAVSEMLARRARRQPVRRRTLLRRLCGRWRGDEPD